MKTYCKVCKHFDKCTKKFKSYKTRCYDFVSINGKK